MTLTKEALLYVSLNCMIAVTGLLVSGSITKEIVVHWSLWICLVTLIAMAIAVIIWFVRQSPINDMYSEVKGKDITPTHLDHYRAVYDSRKDRGNVIPPK